MYVISSGCWPEDPRVAKMRVQHHKEICCVWWVLRENSAKERNALPEQTAKSVNRNNSETKRKEVGSIKAGLLFLVKTKCSRPD